MALIVEKMAIAMTTNAKGSNDERVNARDDTPARQRPVRSMHKFDTAFVR